MKRIEKIISELHPKLKLTADTKLIDDKILDSLDIVTLITEINEEFGTSIGAEDILPENFNTLHDIRALIVRRGGKI